MRQLIVSFVLCFLLITCANEPDSPIMPQATPTTPPPSASAIVSAPATSTPIPTSTADPYRRITATPAATRPPADFVPYGEVEQPPYAASACSDKYPCNDDVAAWEARIRVPEGFTARYLAHLADEQPTSLAFDGEGVLYAAVQSGRIYTIDPTGSATVFFEGLLAPTGIQFRPGTAQLYVSSRVVEDNANGEAQISMIEAGQQRPLITGLPCCYAFMHGPHSIVFDSQGWGYVGVGAKADHGEILGTDNEQAQLDPLEAGVLRFSPDGAVVEKYAEGLRNPYGIAIDAHDQLYATDNGPDFGPPDEFHRLEPGANHGYPWYEGCAVCFPTPADVSPRPSDYDFPPHSAPTGMTAYMGEQFPHAYNNLFATLWSAFPEAQRVVRFGANGVGAETFATGFAAPIAVAADPAGSLYVADWATGIIFKISRD